MGTNIDYRFINIIELYLDKLEKLSDKEREAITNFIIISSKPIIVSDRSEEL